MAGPPRHSMSELHRSTDDATGDPIEPGWVPKADGAGLVDWLPLGAVVIAIGSLTAGGSPATIVNDTSYNAFPGIAWLDNGPYDVGSRLLVTWRKGTDHASTNDGVIRGAILTITDTDPWTYSVGTAFTIYDHLTLDVRLEDGVSVIDDTVYVSGRLYDGSANQSPFVLVADDPASAFTSSTTWTKHDIALSSGSVQNYTQGRVFKLHDGTYGQAIGWQSAGTHSVGIAIVSDPTDWSAPTLHTIGSGANDYAEIDIEVMPDGTLIAQLNGITSTDHYVSTSTDDGATWSSPASIFDGIGWPMFRRLWSGAFLAIYRSNAGSQDAAWRSDLSGDGDADSFGSETILDSTGSQMEYASGIQLDTGHFLAVYAYQTSSTNADVVTQVFSDSSVFPAGLVTVRASDATPGHLYDKLEAGSGIEFAILDSGVDEVIRISSAGSALTVEDEGVPLATAADTLDFVGSGVVASGTGATKTITISGAPTGAAGGDLSGTYPNPSVVDDSHSHTASTLPASSGGAGDHEHIIDVFNGDASTTAFEISNEPLDPEAVFAFVGGSWTAVTVSGAMNTTVTFGSAPGSGTGNVVIQYPAVSA